MPNVPVDQIFQQDPEWLKQNYPQYYSQYVEKVGQPGAGLQQTQTSTAATGAQIPGITAESGIKQTQQKQVNAPLNLKADLNGGMTLSSAMDKYKGLGMSADDIFNNYLSQSPYGLPKESPIALKNMGVSDKELGQPGQANSFADRYNTRNAILELRNAENLFNHTSLVAHYPILGDKTASGKAYNSAKQIVTEHLSSLIPGASSAQASQQGFTNALPNIGDPFGTVGAKGQFDQIEQGLMKTKGYEYKDLGLSPNLSQILQQGAQQSQQITGKDLLHNILQATLPTAGAVGGGVGGAALGALVPGPNLTGISEAAGGIGGASAGGAGGKMLANILSGKPAGEGVPQEATVDAIGGGIGAGAGKILGSILGGAGERLATGSLGFTKMLSNKVELLNGEPVSETLAKNGLTGANAEGIMEKGIKPLQETFDKIAKSNIPLNQDALLQRASAQIEALKNSSVPSAKSTANGVEEAIGNVFNKIANGKVKTLSDLNNERKAFDAATADSQFGSADWGANRFAGQILRNAVQDTADAAGLTGKNGESLKDIGQSLKKLYNISDLAQKRAGMTGGGSPLSVTNLLLGGEIAAPAIGINPLLGAALGFGIRKGMANPTIAKGASTGLATLSKILSNPKTGASVGGGGASLLNSILGQ